MQLIKYYSANNPCYQNNVNKADSRYTTFQSRGPQGLMLHSVGCSQPSAKVFADRWNRSGIEVAVHAVLQADGTVYQCLPWNYRGWHAGSTANNTHVGVEMTEPSQINYTGGSTFTITDKAAAQEQAKGTYQTAVELFAQLCKEYSLDPLGDGVIISHHEGYLRGVAGDHGDPEHLWKGLGLSYTMDGFRKDVKTAMSTANSKYTVGWHKDSKGWWYADTANSYYKSQWAKIKGKWYYFDDSGYMLDNVWKVEADSDTYYLGADGDMQTNMIVGLGSDGRLQPIEPYYHLISELPDYCRKEIDRLIPAGKLAGKSGEGENLVLDMPESAVRAVIICNRQTVQRSGRCSLHHPPVPFIDDSSIPQGKITHFQRKRLAVVRGTFVRYCLRKFYFETAPDTTVTFRIRRSARSPWESDESTALYSRQSALHAWAPGGEWYGAADAYSR